MKKGLKKLLSRTVVLAGLVALSACGQTPAQDATAQQGNESSEDPKVVTVKHEYGETPVEVNPEKVVVFDLGVVDALDYLGVEVTGLPRSGSLPAHLSKFESDEYGNAGSLKEPDLEAVYEMNPDLIIISGRQADYYEELNEIAPTIYMAIDDENYLESFEENMTLLGEIFNKESEVATGLNEVNEQVDALNQSVTELGVNALITLTNEGAVSAYGAISRFGIIHNSFGFLEADSNLEASTHGNKVSFEYIADLNPNYIFVVDRGAVVGGEGTAQSAMDNELVNSTDAAKNGNIVYLDAAVWYTATGGFTSTLKMIDEVSAAIQK